MLTDESRIKERLEKYLEHLLNKKNLKVVVEDGMPNQAIRSEMSKKVKKALQMKNNKATGPDNIPIGTWRGLGEKNVNMLWDLCKWVFEKKKMPKK